MSAGTHFELHLSVTNLGKKAGRSDEKTQTEGIFFEWILMMAGM